MALDNRGGSGTERECIRWRKHVPFDAAAKYVSLKHCDWTTIVNHTPPPPPPPSPRDLPHLRPVSDININSHQLNGTRRLIGKVKFICCTWWQRQSKGVSGEEMVARLQPEPGADTRDTRDSDINGGWGWCWAEMPMLRFAARSLSLSLTLRSCRSCRPAAVVATYPSLSPPSLWGWRCLLPLLSSNFSHKVCAILLKTMIWKEEELNHVYKQLLAGHTRCSTAELQSTK